MKIIISPYSRPLRNGKPNPKNYPFWDALVNLLQDHTLIQIGKGGEEKLNVDSYQFNLSLSDLEDLTLSCDTFISVDNFYPHFCNLIGKAGIVIFGQSNPAIFGWPLHKNIIKDSKYLRKLQFDIWERAEYREDVFVKPEEIVKELI